MTLSRKNTRIVDGKPIIEYKSQSRENPNPLSKKRTNNKPEITVMIMNVNDLSNFIPEVSFGLLPAIFLELLIVLLKSKRADGKTKTIKLNKSINVYIEINPYPDSFDNKGLM